MWARVLEFAVASWLLMSPFIFKGSHASWSDWATAFGSALLVALFAGLSFHPRLGWAHVLSLPVCAWLIGHGYLMGGHPSAPVHQNQILVGLVLLVFAIIPSDSLRPTASWRAYYQRQAEERHRARYGAPGEPGR